MSGLPSLGPCGEGWVVLQAVLLVGIAGAGVWSGPAWTGAARAVSLVVGLGLLAVGWFAVLRGVADLREDVTPFPHPRDGARLIETGAYRRVRHPIYAGLVVGALGWGFVMASPPAVLGAALLLLFFDLKSRREEAWLVDRFPDYGAYRTRTRRFFPGLY